MSRRATQTRARSKKAANSKRSTARARVEPRLDAARPRPQAGRKPAQSAKRKPRSRIGRAFRFTLYWGTIAGLWAVFGVAAIIAYYAAQLPNADSWSVPERPANIRILDRSGALVANRGMGGRELQLSEMSPYLPQAVIAIEDHRFRSHFGFDPVGFGRAMVRNVAGGRLREGGSTLTQQLAKNLFLSSERTFGRKVQELILAVWLESRFTKDEILELYLNRVYFGSGAWGVDAAARTYYDRSARDLTLRQAATLAGVLKAPSRINPKASARRARERSDLVLAAMQREGFVTVAEAKAASRTKAVATRRLRNASEQFVADMAAAEVKQLLGRVPHDLDVTITVDKTWQRAAARSVYGALDAEGKKLDVSQGALVALAPDGAIRALVGGRDYGRSQYNRAATARRQPGSAFKPFVWLAALEAGWSPEATVLDTPLTTGRYRPRNHAGKYRGEVSLAEALTHSSNTVAVRLARFVSPKKVAQVAERLGIRSPLKHNHALALGVSEVTPLELAGAYAAFANGGHRVSPYLVARITDGDGKVLYERRARSLGPRVVSIDHVGAMCAMLADVVRRGTGQQAGFEHQTAGKTGTTQDGRDAWFAGFSGHTVAVTWFGNDDGSKTRASGGGLASRAWRNFMREVHEDVTKKPLPGQVATAAVPAPTERPGTSVPRRPSFIERWFRKDRR